jgi:hypothetical protein
MKFQPRPINYGLKTTMVRGYEYDVAPQPHQDFQKLALKNPIKHKWMYPPDEFCSKTIAPTQEFLGKSFLPFTPCFIVRFYFYKRFKHKAKPSF